MAQSKQGSRRAGKKPNRRSAGSKAKPKKVMALSRQDPVRRAPVKPAAKRSRSVKRTSPQGSKRLQAPRRAVTAAASANENHTATSILDSQMQLFTMLVRWSPLGMLIRQQARLAEAMCAPHNPKGSALKSGSGTRT